MKIRRGDSVVVIAGDDAGATPRQVMQVVEQGHRVVVEGVNQAKKHVRRGHPKRPQGGRLTIEVPMNSSNVMFYCGSCSKGVRLGYRYADDGSKERFCKSCQQSQGVVGRPKTSYAAGQ